MGKRDRERKAAIVARTQRRPNWEGFGSLAGVELTGDVHCGVCGVVIGDGAGIFQCAGCGAQVLSARGDDAEDVMARFIAFDGSELPSPVPGCDCWVARQPLLVQFGTRRGAHGLACPLYRPSRDPVDRCKDVELRERMERQSCE